jgi:hypothetical protein
MKVDNDVERNEDVHGFFVNDVVQDFTWTGLTVTVKDRDTKMPRNLISGISGTVQQGMRHLES